MKRFQPNVKQANRLMGRIRAFNNKLQKVGGMSEYAVTYKDLKEQIRSKKEFDKVMNRMARFLKKGAEKVITNKHGVSYTVWERNEINYAKRAANINRARMRGALTGPRERRIDKFEPFTRGAKDVTQKRDIGALLRSYTKQGNVDYLEKYGETLRENMLRSLEWMQGLPQYRELEEIFLYEPAEVLFAAQNDVYAPTNFYDQYKGSLLPDDEIYDYADYILDAWRKRLRRK